MVYELDEFSQKRIMAARLAKGTVPRWFAALPCDRPFEVWQTTRDPWGEKRNRELLTSTETLQWDHVYPLERRLLSLVERERAEGRRIMLYFEQNDVRNMARRLEWVLKDLHPWTQPNSVAAEDRQQAILQAVQQSQTVVIVPYRRVNEGLNLQSGIDTVIWVEMALNLFMLDQASRRAWRLGKQEEVRIYYLTYANTAGHYKLRKLGRQSGAAAAFAGEPARGALIEHAGADKTTLARLSNLLEQQQEEEAENASHLLASEGEVAQEEEALKAVFARRADELRTALLHGRQWLGDLVDTLPERLNALFASSDFAVSVWDMPQLVSHRIADIEKRRASERQVHPGTTHVSGLKRHSASQGDVPQTSVSQPQQAREDVLVLPCPEPQIGEVLTGTSLELLPVSVPVVGSRAAVIFGRSEHIAMVRPRGRFRRTSPSRDYGRLRHPAVVRDIPSLTQEGQEALHNGQRPEKSPVLVLSLWDCADADPVPLEDTGKYSSDTNGIPAAPDAHQSDLWKQVATYV